MKLRSGSRAPSIVTTASVGANTSRAYVRHPDGSTGSLASGDIATGIDAIVLATTFKIVRGLGSAAS